VFAAGEKAGNFRKYSELDTSPIQAPFDNSYCAHARLIAGQEQCAPKTSAEPDDRSRDAKGDPMKRFILFAILALSCVAPAFAAHFSQSVLISSEVYFGDTRVMPGDYKVVANGTGDNVEVSLLLDGRQVIKTSARVVSGPQQKRDWTAVDVTSKDGRKVVVGILLKNATLVLNEGTKEQ
jgi:hypothetical protein